MGEFYEFTNLKSKRFNDCNRLHHQKQVSKPRIKLPFFLLRFYQNIRISDFKNARDKTLEFII